MEMMNMPRCGMSDDMVANDRVRRANPIVRWPENTITWRLSSSFEETSISETLGRTQTENIMAGALQVINHSFHFFLPVFEGFKSADGTIWH